MNFFVNLKKYFLISVLALNLFSFAPTVHAQSWLDEAWKQTEAAGGKTGANLGEPKDPRYIFANIIKLLLTLVATVMFGLIAYSGYKWMTAQGNDEKVSEAKNTIYNSTIGLIIILASYSLTVLITNLALGRNLGTNTGTGGTLDNAVQNWFK